MLLRIEYSMNTDNYFIFFTQNIICVAEIYDDWEPQAEISSGM